MPALLKQQFIKCEFMSLLRSRSRNPNTHIVTTALCGGLTLLEEHKHNYCLKTNFAEDCWEIVSRGCMSNRMHVTVNESVSCVQLMRHGGHTRSRDRQNQGLVHTEIKQDKYSQLLFWAKEPGVWKEKRLGKHQPFVRHRTRQENCCHL